MKVDNTYSGVLLSKLFSLKDEAYGDFSKKLIPNIERENIIGVRMGALRAVAAEALKRGRADEFLSSLPHRYLEENTLHALIINEQKSLSACIELLDGFLPFVDNWASCDALRPRAIKNDFASALPHIMRYLSSEHCYTARFALEMLMLFGLGDAFSPEFHALAANKRTGDYYLDMMRAWYFATALSCRYDETLPYLKDGRLDLFTHNKTIQKAIESRRITGGQKEELKLLRIGNGRKKTLDVAAAIIRRGEKVLICRRDANRARPLTWEFPGGKLEKGETPNSAAERECFEELAVRLCCGETLGVFIHDYPDLIIRLYAVNARIVSGEPRAIEHDDIRFVDINELFSYELSGADRAIAERLVGGKAERATI